MPRISALRTDSCLLVVHLAIAASLEPQPRFSDDDATSLLQTVSVEQLRSQSQPTSTADGYTHTRAVARRHGEAIRDRNTYDAVGPRSLAAPNRFCMDGKQLPLLYLLGAQKAATTSLAQDLAESGIRPTLQSRQIPIDGTDTGNGCWAPEGPCWTKEFHFWDSHNSTPIELNPTLARQVFLSMLPNCTGLPQILGDYTPNNLRLTPLVTLPAKLGLHYSSWYSRHSPEKSVSLPEALSSVYGSFFARSLKHIALLREPVARMQSAFYHAQALGFHGVCQDCAGPSFEEALAGTMKAVTQQVPVVPDWVWTSLYGRHLSDWLAYFDPEQFMVIPFRIYTKRGFKGICGEISSWVEFHMQCHHRDASKHANAHDHKPLEEDTTSETLVAARAFFATKNMHLARVLARARKDGLRLPYFTGENSETQIAHWLAENW